VRDLIFLTRLTKTVVEIQCQDPVLTDLTPEQLSAIHVMKHEVLAAIHRLYMNVPAVASNVVLTDIIAALSKAIPSQSK
jgi:hypothetical protein